MKQGYFLSGNSQVSRQLTSNINIATALSIGESTVKSHINRLLSKLGVSDRTQAVIIAIKRGLVNL